MACAQRHSISVPRGDTPSDKFLCSRVRDAISSANTGIPTIAIATKNFEDFAHEIATRGGRSGLRVHVLPYPLNEQERADVKAIGEAHFDRMLEDLGVTIEMREAAE